MIKEEIEAQGERIQTSTPNRENGELVANGGEKKIETGARLNKLRRERKDDRPGGGNWERAAAAQRREKCDKSGARCGGD